VRGKKLISRKTPVRPRSATGSTDEEGGPGLNLAPMESLLFSSNAEKRCVPGQAVPQAARAGGAVEWSRPGGSAGFPGAPLRAKSHFIRAVLVKRVCRSSDKRETFFPARRSVSCIVR